MNKIDDTLKNTNDDIHNGKFYFFYRSKLSNWHMKEFEVWGIKFSCGEQAMMAAKAIIFRDSKTLAKIMDCNDPKTMQSLGREVKEYDQQVWEDNREQVMYCISYARFTQIDYLNERLMGTDNKILVEASPVDGVWGIKMEADVARVTPFEQWKGLNLLGLSFTNVRDDKRLNKHRYENFNPFLELKLS